MRAVVVWRAGGGEGPLTSSSVLHPGLQKYCAGMVAGEREGERERDRERGIEMRGDSHEGGGDHQTLAT